ncbi:MAG: DUF4469 domain-containing protein [Prevotellaceae bacterium]|jgi:hypothetical protein|nr:DUF4469 domain-containing protein [Prevotellaceae bacterium]
MLDYTLVENLLTESPDDFTAHPVNVHTFTYSEIADGILKLNVGIGKPEVLSMLEAYEEVIAGIVAGGGAVSTRLFHAHPSVAGVFNTASDSYDPARHHLKINLTPGLALREALAKVKTKKVQVPEATPLLVEVRDVASGAVNDHLTLGGILQISGSRLKFTASDPANGVFLIPLRNPEVRLTQVSDNKPARITALLPATLAAGEYYLEVRTTYMNNMKAAKTLKVGRFHKVLTVGAA